MLDAGIELLVVDFFVVRVVDAEVSATADEMEEAGTHCE